MGSLEDFFEQAEESRLSAAIPAKASALSRFVLIRFLRV